MTRAQACCQTRQTRQTRQAGRKGPRSPRLLLMAAWRRHRDLLHNVSTLVATTGITAALGFAYWAIAARLFDQRAVGYGSAAVSAMTLIGTIGMLGMGTVLIGELPRRRQRAGLCRPESSSVKQPFRFAGADWVSTGSGGCSAARALGLSDACECYRLTPLAAFDGPRTTYRDCDTEAARNSPLGFYHGMVVKHGKNEVVLTGPPAAFAADPDLAVVDLFGGVATPEPLPLDDDEDEDSEESWLGEIDYEDEEPHDFGIVVDLNEVCEDLQIPLISGVQLDLFGGEV